MEKQTLPEIIEGERIVLRKSHISTAKVMYSIIDKERERLRKIFPWVDQTKSAADSANYIQHAEKEWAEGKLFDYGIFLKAEDKYIGNFSAHHLDWKNERCELGYWISNEFEGHGYISEAVKIMERTLFKLGMNRVEIRCATFNDRSAKVAEKNGYIFEGILRKNMINNGVFHDTKVFSKLRTD